MAMIKQTVSFDATAERVYRAFMDEKEHEAFTGSAAHIENKVGGKFSIWDGYASGVTKELVQGKKIVQTWRAADWSENHYSTITLEFRAHRKGCQLTLTQENVPADQEKEITKGWHDYYWKPLQKYFKKSK